MATSPLLADVEDELNRRWRGAWLIVDIGMTSGCSGSYTNNEVHGRMVSARGSERFDPGELVVVHKINLNRKRVELLIDLDEPILKRRQDGPFTLYDEAFCKVEMRFELGARKGGSADEIESLFDPVVRRFPGRVEAHDSGLWNGRVREPYPEDYEETLAEYERWKVLQTNIAVQEEIDQSIQEATRVIDRISTDAEYLSGFAEGVDEARDSSWRDSCGDLLSVTASSWTDRGDKGESREWNRGFDHGQNLVFHLERARRLRGCFLPLPGF
jgi:hypothetical protein